MSSLLALGIGPHFRRTLQRLQGCRLCRRTDVWSVPGGRRTFASHRSKRDCKCSFSWLKPRLISTTDGATVRAFDVQIRELHLTPRWEMAEASSKIEATVKRLREKHAEELKEIQKISDLDMRVKSVIKLDQKTASAIAKAIEVDKAGKAVKKKSLWVRFVDEVKHYKSGFTLLFVDIRVSTKILWKIVRGGTLTRRENRQLVRTVGDLFRLVPFLAFVIIPFMELLLPVALKLFPGMLPSTFTTESEAKLKYRRELVAKLEYAKFLQKTLDEMNPTDQQATSDGRTSKSARDFVDFYNEIRDGTSSIDNEKILKFSKLFEDDITLDNMTRSQLSAICRILELQPVGSKNILAFSIEMKLRALKADDRVIQREGVEQMSMAELQMACKERGMSAYGLQKEQLVQQMKEWLDLSLNAQVPPSLLLLSRTLYLPKNLDPAAQLAQTISALPDSAAKRASAEIGMKEGKTRNVDKLEVIQEEQRKIEEEAAEYEAKAKAEAAAEAEAKAQAEAEAEAKAAADAEMPTPAVGAADKIVQEAMETLTKATVTESGEVEGTVASAEVKEDAEEKVEVIKEQEKAVPIDKRELSAADFSDLKTAIEKLGKVKTESDSIQELKQELEDYKEDLQDLQSVKKEVDRIGLRETKGAQVLYNRVNKMLGRVGSLVTTLQSQKKVIEEQLSQELQKEAFEAEEKHLVTINELIEAVQSLENTPDQAKTEQIVEVLSFMDEDKDGVIQVNHVMKVIELLGTTHAKLPAKQIRQIVEMLAKEEMVRMEEDLEDALHSSLKESPDSSSQSLDCYEEETKWLEDAATQGSQSEQDNSVPDHVKELFQAKKSEKQKNGEK